MGNASSHPSTDPQDILIHQFQLDADFDTCQLPWICPKRNAQFLPPSSLGSNTKHFLSLEEVLRILKDLNTILHETAFNPRPSNPCFLLTALSTFVLPLLMPVIAMNSKLENLALNIVLLLFFGALFPWLIYAYLLVHFRRARRRRLTEYVAQWNSSSKGVKLSLGGGGTTPRGVTVGSHQGGTYENFYMATWDPKSLLFKGYLHVWVNVQERQEWCRTNGQPFVMPVPLGQIQVPDGYQAPPSIGDYQAPPGVGDYKAPPGVGDYQPPPGYAPPGVDYQPPPGYALVPIGEQPPPGFELQRLPV